MKLHELVKLRNDLQTALRIKQIENEVNENLSRFTELCAVSNPKFDSMISNLSEQHRGLLGKLKEDLSFCNNIIEEIQNDIDDLTAKLFNENYQTEIVSLKDPAFIREMCKAYFPDEVKEMLLARVRLHSSWKYPALEIGCRDGEFTKHLVSSDPLYIADNHNVFLDNTVNQFTPEYQVRIRKYYIRNQKIFFLPKNQFNLIFSFNYFNYLSIDSIRQFLHQAMEWLRPGGTMIFTYNNGDMSASAGLSESYFMTFVPRTLLIPLIESIGFEMVAAEDHLPSASWVEFKKPGILKTVKAHQSLGEIVYR